jgi:hypothetical protein
MEDHGRIPHWLAVVVFHDHKAQIGHGPVFLVLSRYRSGEAKNDQRNHRTRNQTPVSHSRPF